MCLLRSRALSFARYSVPMLDVILMLGQVAAATLLIFGASLAVGAVMAPHREEDV